MVITTPTRITIEVTPFQPGEHAEGPTTPAQVVQVIVASVDPADEAPHPTAYESAPCRCLDDDECAADHEHE